MCNDSGEAFAFLVGFVVLSGLLLSVRGSVWASVIGLVSMGVSGFLIAAKVLQPFSVLPGTQANPTDMTAVVLSIVALTATVTALLAAVNTLKFNLIRSLARETQMRNLLQQERDLLEQRVHERTAELREVRDQALRSRNELRTYYRAIEQSGNSIVITDLQGQITYVNPFFEKTTGYAIDEVLGKKLNILSSGHHSKEFYRRLWQTIIQGEIWQGEFLNRRKDGSLYWEFATITPVKDENGQIRHYVAIKEDITAQKELRETLARQNEYLAALQNITLELLDRRGRQELLDNILQRARRAECSAGGRYVVRARAAGLSRSGRKPKRTLWQTCQPGTLPSGLRSPGKTPPGLCRRLSGKIQHIPDYARTNFARCCQFPQHLWRTGFGCDCAWTV